MYALVFMVEIGTSVKVVLRFTTETGVEALFELLVR
jgi:hypothetical protein